MQTLEQRLGPFRGQKEVSELLTRWWYRAEDASPFLLRFSPKEFYTAHGDEELLLQVDDLLAASGFFLGEEERACLRSWAFPEAIFRVLVPISPVLTTLDQMVADGIKFVEPVAVLKYIQTHVHSLWWDQLEDWQWKFVKRLPKLKEEELMPPVHVYAPEERDDPGGERSPGNKRRAKALMQEITQLDKQATIKMYKGLPAVDDHKSYLGSLPAMAKRTNEDVDTFLRRFFHLFALLDVRTTYLTGAQHRKSRAFSGQPYETYQAEMVKRLVRSYWKYL